MKRIEIPSVQAKERTTLASRTSGATSACSRIAEDDRHHQQRQRHDQLQVALGRLVEVVVDRASRRRSRAVTPGSRFATESRMLGDEVEAETCRSGRPSGSRRRLSIWPLVESSPVGRPRRPRHRRSSALLGRQLQSSCVVTGPLSLLHQHRHRRQRPGREVLPQHLEALHALDRLLEEGGARVVDLVREQPERAEQEDTAGDRQRRARAAAGPGRRSAATSPCAPTSACSGS